MVERQSNPSISSAGDLELHKQLIDARASLRAQLDAIADRKRFHYRHTGGGPPDFDPAEAALSDQLREIEELLGFANGRDDKDL